MDILVTVEGQKMKLASNQTHHIEGSSQFVKFIFNLSDEWSGLDSNVQFIQNGEAYGQKLDGSGNKKYAFLPNGITEGECKMVLYGGDGTIRATTNYIPLSIGKDISALSTLSENISRTDYEQALVELKQYVANGCVTEIALNQAFSNAVNEIATEENVKQEIASGIATAKSEIESAKVSIENAKTEISNSVATVKESEEKTKEYANGVQEIIDSAETIKNEANEALVNANEALSNANTALATAEDAIKARDEIIGKTGSVESPEPKSALGEISQARKDILGDDGGGGIVEQVTVLKNQAEAAKAAAESAQEIVSSDKADVEAAKAASESIRVDIESAKASVDETKQEIFGSGNTQSPSEDSALYEIRSTRNEIIEFNKSGGVLEQAKEAAQNAIAYAETASAKRDEAVQSASDAQTSAEAAATSETNVKAVEDKIDQANTSAEQIESFREEMTTAHTEVINARNDILSEGTDGKSVYEKIIDAKTSIDSSKDLIIGSDGTVDDPSEGSALRKVQEAQAAAEKARNEAEGFAESANNGITVINDLTSTDTANALSANQGRVLDESKLNLSGGTMTGPLSLSAYPTEDNHAATKLYVDTHMPSLVTTTNDGVMSTDDKKKLDGIAEEANKYIHPDTHPASMIEEDASHRFVSDTEKAAWNNKSNSDHNHDSEYLKLSGGTLIGNLILNEDPTSDDMAANKKYVDDAISLAIGAELGGIY